MTSPEAIPSRLLDPADPPTVVVENMGSSSAFVVLCDHAGHATPRRLGRLGLPETAFDLHIAYDIGAGPLSSRLGERLGAPVVRQTYSRLVIDCNRTPGRPDSIVEVSDGIVVPGNQGLSPDEVAARIEEVHAPYHGRISQELDRITGAGARPALVLMHSFTPVMAGFVRPWHAGVLHLGDSPLSQRVLELLRRESGLQVGDNEPYAMDGTDYTAPFHAGRRGLPYVELEVRQDLIADQAGQARMCEVLAPVLRQAAEDLQLG